MIIGTLLGEKTASLFDNFWDKIHRAFLWLLNIDYDSLPQPIEWRFEFQGGWPILLVLFTGAILVAFAVWQYRREPLNSFRSKFILTASRAFLLLWLVFLLNQLVVIVEHEDENPSYVVILVDKSLSLSVKDNYKNKEDLAVLHQLGLLLDDDGNTIPADKKIDDIKSAQVTRVDIIRNIFSSKKLNLIRELQKKHIVKLFKFDYNAEELAFDEENIRLKNYKADGPATAVGKALEAVMEEMRGTKLAGIVILTDGNSTEPPNVLKTAEKFKKSNIKIFCVGIGLSTGQTDIVLIKAKVPKIIFVGNNIDMGVEFRINGNYTKKTVPYKILVDGEVVKSGELKLKLGEDGLPLKDKDGNVIPQTAHIPDFKLEKDRADGKPHEIKIVIGPLEEETIKTNNEQVVQNVIIKERIVKVLLISKQGNWEYKYLKNAMGRDKYIRYSAWLQEADSEYPQEASKPEYSIRIPPESLKDWDKYDCVILMGCNPMGLGLGQLALEGLSKAVKQRGVGLIIQTSQYFPLYYYQNTAIEKAGLLPLAVSTMRPKPAELQEDLDEEYDLILKEANHPLGQFDSDKTENAKIWEKLPGLYWHESTGPVNPQTLVVASHSSLKTTDGRQVPLVATLRRGNGSVVYFGIDSFWRWRFRIGNDYFYSWWARSIEYAASFRFRKLANLIDINTSKETYQTGDTAEPEIIAVDKDLRAIKADVIKITLTSPSGIKTQIKPEQEGDALYPELKLNEIGKWELEVITPYDKIKKIFIVEPPKIEFQKIAQNRETLEKIAEITNGAYYTIKDLEKIKDIPKGVEKTYHDEIKEIYATPFMLIIFALFITIEWILRKLLRLI